MKDLEREVMRAELRVYRKAIQLASIALAQAVSEAKRQAENAEAVKDAYDANMRIKELEEYIRLHVRRHQ